MDAFDELLSDRTRIVAMSHVSNALGTINPVNDIVQKAHARGAVVLLDGAQAIPHLVVDVQALDCDFYVFSSHKMFGPTGAGVLYGRKSLLQAMPPYRGGGDMIRSVTFEKTAYNEVPYKFEAGTPNIGGMVGLGAAVDYFDTFDRAAAQAHEDDVLQYATARLRELSGIRIIGEAREKTGVLSFVMENAHPHDAGTILDREGIAVRTGQHCAQPVMDRYCIAATIRASLAIYNTRQDIDALIRSLSRVREVFG
jgi:cysteine desulfurase/selenocysteine lyase